MILKEILTESWKAEPGEVAIFTRVATNLKFTLLNPAEEDENQQYEYWDFIPTAFPYMSTQDYVTLFIGRELVDGQRSWTVESHWRDPETMSGRSDHPPIRFMGLEDVFEVVEKVEEAVKNQLKQNGSEDE